MHVHSPQGDDDVQYDAKRALFAADSIELRRVLVLSSAYSRSVTIHQAKKENDFVAKEVSLNRGSVAGACAVNPNKTWAAREVDRCAGLGFKVLKLHLMASGMDLRRDVDFSIAKSIISMAEKYRMTILIHAHYPKKSHPGEINRLVDLVNQYPNTRWIIGHLLGLEFDLLKEVKHQNFFVEVSMVPTWLTTRSQRESLVLMMRDVGMHRFLFGSDWPVNHPAETMKALRNLPLSNNELQMVVHENSKQLDDLFQ